MVTKNRVRDVVEQGRAAIELLRGVSEVLNTPDYFRPIAGAGVLLMDTVLIVRKNKEECLRMAEQVSAIVVSLVNICSNIEDELPSSIICNIATFSETLQKVLGFVRRQVEKSLIKRVVRHLEDASVLIECQLALDHAVELFKLQYEITTLASLARLQACSNVMNSELSNLLLAQSSRSTLSSYCSSLSEISLLPGSPQIFHGRDTELQYLVAVLLHKDPSRIAILGPGGVGKSALSLAALYNQDVVIKFGCERHFISCASAHSAEDIATALSSHFALEASSNPTSSILQYLSSRGAACVIVLDNMETPWELPGRRLAVEDLLSHLSAIDTLHLIITMRGEERPGNVRWTRPFLRPLAPLSNLAARRVFQDITDAADNDTQVEELLRYTDNLPLAITLMASLVAFEGASPVLERWKSERISLLSEGADKNSNLSTSIMMSLRSPRLTAIPDAVTLLSLLAVLPDGVTDSILAEMDLPLADVASCRVTLCRTSLAYVDNDRRLKALVPIREHMRAFHPPSPALISHMQRFLFNLVTVFSKKWARSVGSGLVKRVSSDLGNIHSLLSLAVEATETPSTDTISCILDLAHFTEVTHLGSWDFLHSIFAIVEQSADRDLQGRYFVALSRVGSPSTNVELYLQQAIHCFHLTNNISAQAMAYHDLALYYTITKGDTSKGLETCSCAITLARRSHDHNILAQVLRRMSGVLHNVGNLRGAWALTLEAQAHAQLAGDLDTEFVCILNRVSHFITAGNYRRAADLCTDLMALAEGLGVEKGAHGPRVLFMQAEIHFRKTEYDHARTITEAIIDITCDQDGQNPRHILALHNLLVIDFARGADVNPEAIQTLRKSIPTVTGMVACDISIADIFHRSGEFMLAHELYSQCLTVARGQYAETTNECFQKLGDNAYAWSRMDHALEYFVLHLAMSRRMEDYENTHQALRRIGDIFHQQDDNETARSLFTLCLEGFTLMDIHKARGGCLVRLGDLFKGKGDVINAARCWDQAIPLFERSSQQAEARGCRLRLTTCVSDVF